MKDNRFIELVNLYVDRQISATETDELEAEIQSNPRRRAIYRQYCQMHRATKLVYESFRADSPEQEKTVAAEGKADIARFETAQRHRRSRWGYYAGGIAAAASLALVVVRINSSQLSTINVAAVPSHPQPAAVVVAKSAPETTGQSPAEQARPSLTGLRSNSLAVEQDYVAVLATLRLKEQRDFASGQIPSGRASSLFEDGVFELPAGLPVNNQRVFRAKQLPAQQAEFTAFQFQR